jgi:hypothetical protein
LKGILLKPGVPGVKIVPKVPNVIQYPVSLYFTGDPFSNFKATLQNLMMLSAEGL